MDSNKENFINYDYTEGKPTPKGPPLGAGKPSQPTEPNSREYFLPWKKTFVLAIVVGLAVGLGVTFGPGLVMGVIVGVGGFLGTLLMKVILEQVGKMIDKPNSKETATTEEINPDKGKQLNSGSLRQDATKIIEASKQTSPKGIQHKEKLNLKTNTPPAVQKKQQALDQAQEENPPKYD